MQPIGVFDSGYGGLTVLQHLVKQLPQYDFLYLGDNARAPYGTRSYETVYQYTLEAVQWFFKQNCPLVILACNTASAKALRTIQQKNLPNMAPHKRVLGVIRPTAEVVANYSKTGHIGILGTTGTIQSQSYPLEIGKFAPAVQVYQQACPMWVPLIENNEFNNAGTAYFIQKYLQELLQQSSKIDTILLACTHYPLLENQLKEQLPANTTLLSQGHLVASSLENYLQRHPEIAHQLSTNGKRLFYTTDTPEVFDAAASRFFGSEVKSMQTDLS
jgi:glutamate racemase